MCHLQYSYNRFLSKGEYIFTYRSSLCARPFVNPESRFKIDSGHTIFKLWIFNSNICSVWIAKHVHMQQVNVVIRFIFVVFNDGITRNKLVLFVQTNGSMFQLVLKILKKGMTLMNNKVSDFFITFPSFSITIPVPTLKCICSVYCN